MAGVVDEGGKGAVGLVADARDQQRIVGWPRRVVAANDLPANGVREVAVGGERTATRGEGQRSRPARTPGCRHQVVQLPVHVVEVGADELAAGAVAPRA